MPWTLTTPVAVGDLDPAGPYTQVKIVRQAHDSVRGMIAVDLEYGNTVNDEWKPGLPIRSKPTNIIIQGEEYTALVTDSEPETDEKTYDAVKRGLYEFLATKNMIGPGTLT
jgi:hypothetical protein